MVVERGLAFVRDYSAFQSLKICFVHKIRTLLGHLEDGGFGVGFDQFCPHLHFYTTYVDNFQSAKKILAVSSARRVLFFFFKFINLVFFKTNLNELHATSLKSILSIIVSTCL